MKTIPAKAKIGLLFCLLSLALTAAGQQRWPQTTSLPDGYSGQSLVYWNGFLYQAGGSSNENGLGDGFHVFYAQVHTNGTIGNWNTATPLPECVDVHAGVVGNGFLYVMGGYHYNDEEGIFLTNTVYYAKINPDGSVGTWQTANPLPRSLYGLTAAVWNGRIYVVGGTDNNYFYADVWSAQIQTDGSLSPWVAQASFPFAICTQAEVANGFVYVLGGYANNGATLLNNVYYSKINADGTLAGWNQTAPMPQALSYLGAVVARGWILVAGGTTSSYVQNGVYSAPVAGDGSLGTWSSGPANLVLLC